MKKALLVYGLLAGLLGAALGGGTIYFVYLIESNDEVQGNETIS